MKQLWKQIISMMLVIAMLGLSVTPAQAAEKNGEGIDTLRNNNLEKLLTQEPEYDVTEEEVEAFEEAYEKEAGQGVRPQAGSNTAVSEFAQKKAAVLTALYGLDSVQYALIEDGEITVSGSAGYNDKAKQTQPADSTMYGIASISKIFTTTAVLQLVEDGKVNLDEPITTYITDFKMQDARYKNITVRMLLNHTSGFLGGSLNNSLLFDDNDTKCHDSLLKTLSGERLKADPGDFSVYCNDGFSVAEILVERVTGQTFSDYVAENITGPLSLTSTKTPRDSFNRDNLAGIYNGDTKLPAENFNSIGTGGFYSTAKNLCRFAEVFMDNSAKTDILSNASSASMAVKAAQGAGWTMSNQSTDGFGLGWDSVNAYPFDQYNIKALTKGGDSYYYHGSLIVLPGENKAVAVLSSQGSSSLDQIFGSAILLQALYEDGTIKELPAENPSYGKPIQQIIPTDLMQYEGFYVTMGGMLEIKMDSAGALTLRNVYAAGSQLQLIHVGNGKFRTAEGSNEYSFATEGNGEKYLWGGGYSILPGLGTYFGENYQAQKVENNVLSDSVKEVWKTRENKLYFIINEKYSSANYINSGLFMGGLSLSENVEGYAAYMKITSEDTARMDMVLPDVGRDLQDLVFYTKSGIEYIKINDYVAVSQEGVKAISSKSKFGITIGSNGYAKWYTVGSGTAGKTMTVTVPENGSFTVYRADGTCKTCSYVSGKTKVKLPKGGYVVFAGDAKAKFTVKMS